MSHACLASTLSEEQSVCTSFCCLGCAKEYVPDRDRRTSRKIVQCECLKGPQESFSRSGERERDRRSFSQIGPTAIGLGKSKMCRGYREASLCTVHRPTAVALYPYGSNIESSMADHTSRNLHISENPTV